MFYMNTQIIVQQTQTTTEICCSQPVLGAIGLSLYLLYHKVKICLVCQTAISSTLDVTHPLT